MKEKPTLSETFIALAPALVQVIGFLAIELNDRLNLKNFFIYPEIITVINIFIIIFTLCLILTYLYWKNHYYVLMKNNGIPRLHNEANESIEEISANFGNTNYWITLSLLAFSCFVAAISFLLLVCSLLIKDVIDEDLTVFLGIAQWLLYILFVSSSSFAIYLGLLDKREIDRGKEERQNFSSTVLTKVREAGWFESPKIIGTMQFGVNQATFIDDGNGKTLRAVTSWDGKELFAVDDVTPQTEASPKDQKSN